MHCHRNRAYIGITKIAVDASAYKRILTPRDLRVTGERAPSSATIEVKNFGQSTASEIVVFGYWDTVEIHTRLPDDYGYGQDLDNLFPDNNIVRTILSRFLLQSGQTHTTTIAIPKNEPWFRANKGECYLYFFGRVYYTDVYGSKWKFKFCYLWEPKFGGHFTPYEEYNEEEEFRP
jgi:hypothetical protein